MAKVIVWRLAGFREVRLSPGVQAELLKRAQKIADKAGEGIAAIPDAGRNRGRVAVVTINGVGVGRNANGHVILKSIDAGR